MKIQSYTNLYSPNFSSRNKEVRKADDIMRNAKNAFPMWSSTYADTHYETLKDGQNSEACKLSDKLGSKLFNIRTSVQRKLDPLLYQTGIYGCENEESICFALDEVKKHKLGNCFEATKLALAALYANGYTHSAPVQLKHRTEIINKNTNKTAFVRDFNLDHVFAITDMNKKGGVRNVVIDPWLSFADSISGAKERYKKIYSKETLDKHKNISISKFKKELEKKGCSYNPNDYEIRSGLYFDIDDYNGISLGGRHAKEVLSAKYPELIV